MPMRKELVVVCPFCGRIHARMHQLLNAICPCGSKYYGAQEFWLNRKTGERKDVKQK